MANNYRQFSGAIDLKSEEEVAWCKARLDELRCTREEDSEKIEEGQEIERYESFADFDFDFAKDTDGAVYLWIYSEEGGSTNHVSAFVQEFLAKFRPTECWWMSWADTCSKLRVNEFSGGAVFVTATEVKFVEAQAWACEREAEHRASIAARSAS